jgi:hypothetical protein
VLLVLAELLLLDALQRHGGLRARHLVLLLLGLRDLDLHVLLAARQLNGGLGVLGAVQLAHVLGRALEIVGRPVGHLGLGAGHGATSAPKPG